MLRILGVLLSFVMALPAALLTSAMLMPSAV
jgi:hypothetical protein